MNIAKLDPRLAEMFKTEQNRTDCLYMVLIQTNCLVRAESDSFPAILSVKAIEDLKEQPWVRAIQFLRKLAA